ncbi:MAG: hypothetical protein C4589_07540 [Peptococcaceae bacterium]|nr:MAG: hypothetical protein C4589_07540 [Peptococcaceae bacterium]
MNKKFILIIAAIAVLATTVIGMTNNSFHKEPQRTSEVPEYAKWDSTEGCYINTKAIEFEEIANKQPAIETGAPSEKEMSEWLTKNKNTKDVVDKAIIEWHSNSKMLNDPFVSYYIPSKDDAFNKYLTSLPDKEIENMVKKIESNHPWRSILMQAVEAKINNRFAENIDPSQEGTQKWVAKYKEFKDKSR